jgi:ribonuclease HI
LINEISEKKITFQKVKGHSKNRLNNEADKRAVNAKKLCKKTQKTIGYNQKPDSLLGKK